jgi:hypothetical protein
MTAQTPLSSQSLYEQDYVLWAEKTAEQLRQKAFADLDLENLIEELEDMGRSERRAVENLLTRLLEHLLKLAYWRSERERNARHWMVEIASFRVQLLRRIKTTTLEDHGRDFFPDAYADTRQVLLGAKIVPKTSIPVEPLISKMAHHYYRITTEQENNMSMKLNGKDLNN